MLFNATRTCLLNGIPDLATRPDLADRAIVVTLPVIQSTERKVEGEFNKALEVAMPRIFAGLLDVISKALANIGSVRLTEAPRMADFAKWALPQNQPLAGLRVRLWNPTRQTGNTQTVQLLRATPWGWQLLNW